MQPFDLRYMQKKTNKLSSKEQAIEWVKCKMNPFYLIYNYVYIPEVGGILKYTPSHMHSKFRQTVRSIHHYHKVVLMATRQLGKSTIAGCLLEWGGNFYPGLQSTILNANKSYALENLNKVKFIHTNLPPFLRIPLKYKGDRKKTMEYEHGSVIRTFYPSPSTSASTLARSLTSPILYIDEAGHISHMVDAYTAAQPTLSRAREQAKRNNYPYFILVTSTPNGTVGTGEWFFDLWQFSTESENLFDDNDILIPEADEIVDNPERNGFVRVRFKWDEDPSKDEAWYREQCRDLNFNQRSINQELDLLFVGSTFCIFPDDYLAKLKPIKVIERINLPHATRLDLYTDRFNTDDFLLIGCDTAKSLVGDYNGLEIFSYKDLIQIGEYFGKLGSLTKYSDVIMAIVRFLAPMMNDRLILCIENNSIGSAIIENLENATDYDYMQYVYSPEPEKFIGINTNTKTKSAMISFLYDYMIDSPENIRSSDLINQFNVIERRANGAISAQSGKSDDLFMASALCAYVRRLSSLEYEPMLGLSTFTYRKQNINMLQNVVRQSSIPIQDLSAIAGYRFNKEEGGYEYTFGQDEGPSDEFDDGTPFAIF